MGQHNKIFSVRFVVTYGVAATAVIVIGTGVFYFGGREVRESLLFLAACCAAAGQLAAALYTARILEVTVTQSLPAEDRAERFGERWTDASMFHMRSACETLIDDKNDPDKILNDLKADRQKATNASNVLNFLEELALSVNTGRCSETTAKALFCGIILNIWHATEKWVKAERTARGRAQMWCELEKLYNMWKT